MCKYSGLTSHRKNLLERIHLDINLGGFGIQPVFADSETCSYFFCFACLSYHMRINTFNWFGDHIFFYTLFIKVSSERQDNLIFASDKRTILLILMLVKYWKLTLLHWSSRKSHYFVSCCHLVYLSHMHQGAESSVLRVSMLLALCIPKYLCNNQQSVNYWWIHTCAVFHICCISSLESRLTVVYFQVQDLGFNFIMEKNTDFTVNLHFRTLYVRQSP